MTIGIVRYGVAIPSFRITTDEIAKAWGTAAQKIEKSLGVTEKSVADLDEDTATLAIEAGQRALKNIAPQQIGAIYLGSESHPYAVKPTATIVGNALGCGSEYMAADIQFACKAGTAALQMVMGLLGSQQIEYGMAIGSDTAQGSPGDILEYTAASGAAAYVLGRKKSEIIATLDATSSYSTDTPDFWRERKSSYPEHAGRFTGQPAYFHHVVTATQKFLQKIGKAIPDFDHIIFHSPNGVFPKRAAKILHANQAQIQKGLLGSHIGNTYSATCLLSLANVLDTATPGEKILLTSYGSGAGADCFAFTVTDNIASYQTKVTVQELLAEKTYISYPEYLRMRGKILQGKSGE